MVPLSTPLFFGWTISLIWKILIFYNFYSIGVGESSDRGRVLSVERDGETIAMKIIYRTNKKVVIIIQSIFCRYLVCLIFLNYLLVHVLHPFGTANISFKTL
jgi:hypothetical protein